MSLLMVCNFSSIAACSKAKGLKMLLLFRFNPGK
jgi:hypothetical protein